MRVPSTYKIAIIFLLTGSFCLAQEKTTPKKFAQYITPEDLRTNLTIVASDALEGRLTGSRGQKMAAAFIRYEFQQMGLDAPAGSYLQEFELYSRDSVSATLSINNSRFVNYKDIVYTDLWNGAEQISIVYGGDGSEKSIANLELTNKTVLIWWRGFSFGSLQSTIEQLQKKRSKLVMVYPDGKPGDFEEFARQIQAFQKNSEEHSLDPASTNVSMGVAFINKNVLNALYSDSKKLKNHIENPSKIEEVKGRFQVNQYTNIIHTENVLGLIEGTDKKNEAIVITAHYDHIGISKNGIDKINNGADDDGSGTVAILQIAKAFTEAKKQGYPPRRSILFLAVSAEELGLHGSQYYTDHPTFPLSNTMANLNIDMIGRRDSEHNNNNYIYVIGADKLSTELHEINELNNSTYTKLQLDYTYNDENHPSNLYQRSDHWNFAKNNIPIIFYFDGIHDDYHQPSDEIEKIDFDILTKRTQLIFYTAWELAFRYNRLTLNK